MVDSGIKATKECTDTLSKMDKVAKAAFDYVFCQLEEIGPKKYQIIASKIVDVGECEKRGEGDHKKLSEITKILKEEYANDGCWVLFYLHYMEEGTRPQDKLTLLQWSPDTMPMKKKMLFSSTGKGLHKKCPEGAKLIVINSPEDLTHSNLVSEYK